MTTQDWSDIFQQLHTLSDAYLCVTNIAQSKSHTFFCDWSLVCNLMQTVCSSNDIDCVYASLQVAMNYLKKYGKYKTAVSKKKWRRIKPPKKWNDGNHRQWHKDKENIRKKINTTMHKSVKDIKSRFPVVSSDKPALIL